MMKPGTPKIHSPLQNHYGTPNYCYDTNTVFDKSRKYFIPISLYWEIIDVYIDNIITIITDHADWITKGQHASPLTVHTVCRSTNETDPPKHAQMVLSFVNWTVKAQPTKEKNFPRLGSYYLAISNISHPPHN